MYKKITIRLFLRSYEITEFKPLSYFYRNDSDHVTKIVRSRPDSPSAILEYIFPYIVNNLSSSILTSSNTLDQKILFLELFFLTLINTVPRFNDPDLEGFKFENILGKGGNAGIQHFLLFPQCFLPS